MYFNIISFDANVVPVPYHWTMKVIFLEQNSRRPLTKSFPLAITSFSSTALLSEPFLALLPVAHRVRRATSVSHILRLGWETSLYPKRLRSFGEMRVNRVDMGSLIGIPYHVAQSDWSICWILVQGNYYINLGKLLFTVN